MSVYKENELKVEEFVLQSLKERSQDVEDGAFHFKPLKETDFAGESEDVIRTNREDAEKSGFKFSTEVKKYRGIDQQEKNDFDQRVSQEVALKYEEVSQQAYQEGINLGKEDGRREALELSLEELKEQVANLQTTLSDLSVQKETLLKENKEYAQGLIKNIAKWVCLKEIKEDEEAYIGRLLEKLIDEVGSKSNLKLRVSKDLYDKMPEILDEVRKKVSSLQKVEVDIDASIDGGMILESDNGIVEASLKTQFAMIDKLFHGEE